MTAPRHIPGWEVTPDKIREAVRRIVATADPLQIIVFGSRARGDHQPDSDLDLAVILDAPEDQVRNLLDYSVLSGLSMPVDLVIASKARYDLHRPWINSVFNYIQEEGAVIYDRQHPQSACSDVDRIGSGGRLRPAVPAA